MLNRQQRRAAERAAKKTHKLEPQVCVVWLPAAAGYFAQFTSSGYECVGDAARAQLCCEHTASRLALLLRDRFGERAEVRPYVEISHRQTERCAIAAQP